MDKNYVVMGCIRLLRNIGSEYFIALLLTVLFLLILVLGQHGPSVWSVPSASQAKSANGMFVERTKSWRSGYAFRVNGGDELDLRCNPDMVDVDCVSDEQMAKLLSVPSQILYMTYINSANSAQCFLLSASVNNMEVVKYQTRWGDLMRSKVPSKADAQRYLSVERVVLGVMAVALTAGLLIKVAVRQPPAGT